MITKHKNTEIYSLAVLGTRSQKSRCWQNLNHSDCCLCLCIASSSSICLCLPLTGTLVTEFSVTQEIQGDLISRS